jgi:cation:H+ antiporter
MESSIPWLSIVFILGGLAALAWSSDIFVAGASSLAKALGISPLIIGMVIIGFGTSAPEFCVSVMSGLDGHANISLGNAYGSDAFNIAVILGISAFICPLVVRSQIALVAGSCLVLITMLSMWILHDGDCSRLEALMLVGLFALIMPLYCWYDQRSKKSHEPNDEKSVSCDSNVGAGGMAISALKLVVGLCVLVGSSHLLIKGCVDVAKFMGVSDLVIGLTVVAAGTSLPELASAIASARRREHEFVLGNIIGSNIFNTLAVVGVAVAISPLELVEGKSGFSRFILARDLPYVAALSLSLILFAVNWRDFRKEGRIARRAACVWIVSFVLYTILMFVQETGAK